jgi:AcrR family transcriptional regulator
MRQRKPAKARKAEIVETALRLAEEIGPDRLTTEAIAVAVGLTQPAVFRHYPTKDALWQGVADAIAARMQVAWREATDRPGDPVDRLLNLVDAQLGLVSAMPAIPAILFSRALHVENAGLRGIFLGLMTRYRRTIAGEVRRAQRAGAIRSDLGADDAALLLIGLVQGLAVRWSLSGRGFDLREEGRRLSAIQLALLRPPADRALREDAGT